MVSLAPDEVRSLSLQRLLGRCCLLPLGGLILLIVRWRFKISIANLTVVRKQFEEVVRLRKPLLICSNHLTLIDSVIILWALVPLVRYVFQWRLFAWNVPAIENFCRKPTWKLATYLTKCVPIDRAGTPEHTDEVLKKLSYLINDGDVVLIFPEAGRSRTGRVDPDAAAYGTGKIISQVPDCHVLCIYHRGEDQETYSDWPKEGDRYHFYLEVIRPETAHSGLRAMRDLTRQVMLKIKEMEDKHFVNVSNLDRQ